jgi:hypothetical protein
MQMHQALVALGVEIGHESSNAQDQFCRDGTISWLHGIYGLARPDDAFDGLELCAEARHRMLHTPQFETGPCSYRRSWSECWRRQCEAVFRKSFGCLRDRDDYRCETPFRRRLLQVRHPLNTVASLVVKYCESDTSPGSRPHRHLEAVLGAFFPSIPWGSMEGGCVQILGRYWTEYNARLTAKVHHTYRIEDTSPCEVAELAGFLDEHAAGAADAPFAPTMRRVKKRCAGEARRFVRSEGTVGSRIAFTERPGRVDAGRRSRQGKVNRVNRGKVRLVWKDVEAVDPALSLEMRTLARTFGYNEEWDDAWDKD